MRDASLVARARHSDSRRGDTPRRIGDGSPSASDDEHDERGVLERAGCRSARRDPSGRGRSRRYAAGHAERAARPDRPRPPASPPAWRAAAAQSTARQRTRTASRTGGQHAAGMRYAIAGRGPPGRPRGGTARPAASSARRPARSVASDVADGSAPTPRPPSRRSPARTPRRGNRSTTYAASRAHRRRLDRARARGRRRR